MKTKVIDMVSYEIKFYFILDSLYGLFLLATLPVCAVCKY